MRYAISDVHGCIATLENLLAAIGLNKKDHLFFLGDMLDKGPGSKLVFDTIIDLQDKGYHVNLIRGNREQDFLDLFYADLPPDENWLKKGGRETLQSFNGQADFKSPIKKLVPIKYFKLIEQSDYWIELDKFLLAHAGFDFKADDIFEDKDIMLQTRYFIVDPIKSKGKIVIRGHVPRVLDEIRLSIQRADEFYTISIDGGCIYHKTKGMGNLVALEIDTRSITAVPNIDTATNPVSLE